MSTCKDSSWYLIYTKPRQERVAEEHLNRQGYQTYLPFIQRHQRRRGRYQLITEPTFPRYLFIFLYQKKDNWSPIRSTRGVTTLVQFGGVPAEVPTNLIQFLEKNEQLGEIEKPTFSRGQPVQILDGVMAGYEGIFEEQSGARRVTILLMIANQYTRVQLAMDDVDIVV